MNDHNQLLYSSPLGNVGIFDCPVEAPDFGNTGPIREYLLAFPLTAVKIRHADKPEAIVADPNTVTIYNKGQEYERFRLSRYGDRCYWLTVCPQQVGEALATLGALPRGDPVRLFRVSHGVSDLTSYATLHRLVSYLQHTSQPDCLQVEENLLTIFHRNIARAYASEASGRARRSTTRSSHRQLIRQTREVLATCYSEDLSLQGLAIQLNVSAFHLCRVFRAVTGHTIHQYLTQLRLRNALSVLDEGRRDLATLAVETGFSDHSHFTQAFRRAFGTTPSHYRKSIFAP